MCIHLRSSVDSCVLFCACLSNHKSASMYACRIQCVSVCLYLCVVMSPCRYSGGCGGWDGTEKILCMHLHRLNEYIHVLFDALPVCRSSNSTTPLLFPLFHLLYFFVAV